MNSSEAEKQEGAITLQIKYFAKKKLKYPKKR